MINIDKLYDHLADKGFQEPDTGNLFFPAYIYSYAPEKEYEIRNQLMLLGQKLKRPNNFLDCLMVNIYEELIDYLKHEHFTGNSLFDQIIAKETEDPLEANNWIRDEISDGNFYPRFKQKVMDYFQPESEKRVYLIIYGFGSAFPYLRASEFLKNTESLIKEFKVLLFYPGSYEKTRYSLFGLSEDDHMYRANNLNIFLGE